jgi:hypothetical protein
MTYAGYCIVMMFVAGFAVVVLAVLSEWLMRWLSRR